MRTRLSAVGEYALLQAFWGLCSALPVERASRLGARLFGAVGPRLFKHRHVRRNLAQALGPGTPDAVIEAAAHDVWRGFGAVMAEYPHLGEIIDARLEVVMPDSLRNSSIHRQPAMFLSGHLGNWELAAAVIAREWGPISVVYSAQDNVLIDAAVQRYRGALGVGFAEKDTALRALMAAFAGGQSLGLLPDQRVDTGIDIPLCGLPAPTTTSPARMALRLGCPVIPIWVERTGDARYRVTFDDPLPTDYPGLSRRAASERLTELFHQRLEAHIRANPGQWLCTKRRWAKLARPVPTAPGADAERSVA